MDEILKEIENFFLYQKKLYGDRLFLSDDIKTIDTAELEKETQASHSEPHQTVSQEGTVDDSAKHPLVTFYHQIKNCTKCDLAKTRTNFVFGAGDPNAQLMFIGEAPGREEDLQGKPFVGRAGKLLDLMLHAIGLKRSEVFIANVLKCRPPNNRDPMAGEIEKCEPYLLKQIELINPKLIVALGRYSATLLLKQQLSLSDMRQTDHEYNNVPLIVTYHPAALLRTPQWKKNAWDDLKKVRHNLDKLNKKI